MLPFIADPDPRELIFTIFISASSFRHKTKHTLTAHFILNILRLKFQIDQETIVKFPIYSYLKIDVSTVIVPFSKTNNRRGLQSPQSLFVLFYSATTLAPQVAPHLKIVFGTRKDQWKLFCSHLVRF